MENKQQIKQNKHKQNTPMTRMKNQAKTVNGLVKASAGRSLHVGHAPPVQDSNAATHPRTFICVSVHTPY